MCVIMCTDTLLESREETFQGYMIYMTCLVHVGGAKVQFLD